MSEIIETLALSLASEVYDTLPIAYEKYSRIADLRSVKLGITVRLAQAAILERNTLDFQKLLNDINFQYSIRVPDVQKVCEKVIENVFAGRELAIVDNEDDSIMVRVGNTTFNINRQNKYFPFQDDLIELITLSIFSGGIEAVEGKTTHIKPDQKIFNVKEAAEFTGYKKSYLYKAKSEGILKAGQPKKGGALKFRREDLMEFMFRKESLLVEDFVIEILTFRFKILAWGKDENLLGLYNFENHLFLFLYRLF